MRKHPQTLVSTLLARGERWAEEQHAAGAPDEWRATWQEAERLGLAESSPRHELASHVAVAARQRWRELRPGAPVEKPRKSPSGTSRDQGARRAAGAEVISASVPLEVSGQARALAERWGLSRSALLARLVTEAYRAEFGEPEGKSTERSK
jgi:hypothetical protein